MSNLSHVIREAKLNISKEYIVGVRTDIEGSKIAVVFIEKDSGEVSLEYVANCAIVSVNVALVYAIDTLGLKLTFAIERNAHGIAVINYLLAHKYAKLIYKDYHETFKERVIRMLKFKPAPNRYGVYMKPVVRKTLQYLISNAERHGIPVTADAVGAYVCALYVKDRI